MTTRDDLIALTADKLAALASRGLVKRAQKRIAQGKGPTLHFEDETLVAIDGDVRTEIPRDLSLARCPCTCPATQICHHRVAAILAYQSTAASASARAADRAADRVLWSPGSVTDEELARHLGKRIFARARKHQAGKYIATLQRPRAGDDTPSARLATCTVRFLVPESLAHVRCDCTARTPCEHIALAVWAFRLGDKDPQTEQVVEVSGQGKVPARVTHGGGLEIALRDALEVTHDLLLVGIEGADDAVHGRVARAHAALVAAEAIWPADALDDLGRHLLAYQTWSDDYALEEASSCLTELHARARAATRRGKTPRAVILGTGQAPETPLARARLVGLGAAVDERQGSLRARVFFADPSSQTLLVWHRQWPREVPQRGASSLGATETALRDSSFVAKQRLRGLSIPTLAAGQIVLQGAIRRANGALRLHPRVKSMVTPQVGRWDDILLPPLLTTLAAEAKRCDDRPPRYLRPRILTEAIRVLAVSAIDALAFRPDMGILEASARDGEGAPFRIVLRDRPLTPHAIAATAAALEGDVRFISGALERHGEGWSLRPLAIVSDTITLPDLTPDPPRAPVMPYVGGDDDNMPLPRALHLTRTGLDRLIQRGLVRSASYADSIETCRRDLSRAGLEKTAARLMPLIDALHRLASRGDKQHLAETWLDASLRVDLALAQI